MNVSPTKDCHCATCEYLRKAEQTAQAASAPTVNPWPWIPIPMPPAPQPGTAAPQGPFRDGSGICACGARVGNMQVHQCPFTVTCWDAATAPKMPPGVTTIYSGPSGCFAGNGGAAPFHTVGFLHVTDTRQ